MRRLPIYFLIDTSRSMTGGKIDSVNEVLEGIVNILRNNPISLEVGYVSIITFSTEAKQVLPLTSLLDIHMPAIEAIGWTNIESGLQMLLDSMQKEIVISDRKSEIKGDYKPIVVIFSDGGQSKGNYHNILGKVHSCFAKCKTVLAFVATGGKYRSYFDEMKEIVGEYGEVKAINDFNSAELSEIISIVTQTASHIIQ